MVNFYRENKDLITAFKNAPWDRIVPLIERDYKEAEKYDSAPKNLQEAIESYELVLDLIGQIAGDKIAPDAEEVDACGITLSDGVVTYAPPTQKHLKELYENGLMGLTLPRKYGGNNLPTVLSTAAMEIIARADAGLLTLFALQGCAETINFFASEEIKNEYVPRAIQGETMAMVLTEPNAGSDLGSVKTKAEPTDKEGIWEITGQKCFITNGCGEILLVLARSEAESKDARGLSLFVVEKGEGVEVARIENKLGIHGSPTCVINFDKARGKLVGKRKFGLSRYVMQLMFGARLAIAAQSLGIMQAAYEAAKKYAGERKQFGHALTDFQPIREMLLTMKTIIEASRALVYDAAAIVDYKVGWEKKQEEATSDEERAEARQMVRKFDGIGDCITPLCKFFTCEWVQKVCYLAMQVHGGYGYMKEYGVERLYRDARITSIYEGTSQIQAGHAAPKIMKGTLNDYLEDLRSSCPDGEMKDKLEKCFQDFQAVVNKLGQVDDPAYRRLCDWHLVEITSDLLCSYYLLRQAQLSDRKMAIARKFISDAALRIKANKERVLSGEQIAIDEFESVIE
ncbi:MAG: acyl-CoA dehydrogenase family protein [Planctomycetota bacterium]|jgi:alkylation response protein AidB-like acyl-CoA dehydrogenase